MPFSEEGGRMRTKRFILKNRPTTVEGWADLIEAEMDQKGGVKFRSQDLSGELRKQVEQEIFKRAAARVEARKHTN